MTALSSSLKEKCLKVTLMMHESPCCKIFIEPVDTATEEDMSNYFNIIQNPQDIQTILGRIKDDYYQTCEQWEEAMRLVFDNAILFYGSEERYVELNMARAMKKKFYKLCKFYVLPYKSNENWMNTIELLYQKINSTMKKSPPSIKGEFENKTFSYSAEQTNKIRKLCTALSMLTDKSSQYELMQLLAVFGVKIDSKKKENTFKLLQLPAEALQALMIYTKDRFKSLEMDYPE